VTYIGSLLRPINYDWRGTKEKITLVDDVQASVNIDATDMDEKQLKRAYKFSVKSGVIMTLVLLIAWPIPLYVSGYVFDLGVYYIWAGLGIAWTLFAMFVVIVLPIIESRKGIAMVFKAPAATEDSTTGNGEVKRTSDPGPQ